MALHYLDEDVSDADAPLLRGPGHDAISTADVGNRGQKDPLQRAFAVRHGGVLVTCNRADVAMLHLAWIAWSLEWASPSGMVHPGILVVLNGNIQVAAHVAQTVDELVRTTPALENRLFRWQAQGRWQEMTIGGNTR